MKFQVFARPAFAFNAASVEFLKAMNQPGLLLLEHLNISSRRNSLTWKIRSVGNIAKLTPWGAIYYAPSFSLQKRRWHYLLDIANKDWICHTIRVSACWTITRLSFTYTLDFFRRHLSHALHTLFRTLTSERECLDIGVDWRAAIIDAM